MNKFNDKYFILMAKELKIYLICKISHVNDFYNDNSSILKLIKSVW